MDWDLVFEEGTGVRNVKYALRHVDRTLRNEGVRGTREDYGVTSVLIVRYIEWNSRQVLD